MFDLKKLREAAMREGMKLMGNPRVMKLMSNPRVMKMMMGAFQLRGNVQAAVDARVKSIAKSLKLATQEEVRDLKATIRTLESQVERMQAARSENGHAKHAHG